MRYYFRAAAALVAGLAFSGSANASVTLYTSRASFLAANAVSNTADFEGVTAGFVADPFTQNGITFHNRAGGALYLAPANGAGTSPDNATQLLEANGDENFRIGLSSGSSFGAIGFDFYSNAYGPAAFSLFSANGSLIASFTNTQAPNTIAFIGFSSTDPIAYLDSLVDRGWRENTAIDNVLVGSGLAGPGGAVPEPGAWALMILGFGAAGANLRRRRGTIVGI